mmetsp:Transcript_38606/g.83942  ORF Transcript_38606/g.83942 Transcript_38606/m.83942 type:complete len:223 (+) Transcript_38606:128-796(+)|eukprot:CAMPEP_0118947842 /NCGR_PEP_ID=MMETSP1169-20130426/46740_1 /TAXON_ID=36882 /ORGANISM="Pyramimonas obovata, Strain CCMP722" /LENGTH=222 /DNA_ID=CAMNT_0006894135 /DNA_START=106 /DNA_END=774 /DNA_ORIENTATION=+
MTVVDDERARLKALMAERTALEAEMNEIIARLTAPGGAGLTESLVDKEGFPRADVDVHQARISRNRLAVLKNDHKDLSARLEQGLLALHASASNSGTRSPVEPQTVDSAADNVRSRPTNVAAEPMEEDTPVPSASAFAMIDEVTSGSPAADDGLLVGDLVVQFGEVRHSGGGELARVAQALQQNVGSAMQVVVQRQGLPCTLSVTPRPWAGRGYLGCHMRPL